MARRRRRRRSRRQRTRVSESKKILRGPSDNMTAAHLLNEINADKNNVLDATDLNESFELFKLRHKRK